MPARPWTPRRSSSSRSAAQRGWARHGSRQRHQRGVAIQEHQATRESGDERHAFERPVVDVSEPSRARLDEPDATREPARRVRRAQSSGRDRSRVDVDDHARVVGSFAPAVRYRGGRETGDEPSAARVHGNAVQVAAVDIGRILGRGSEPRLPDREDRARAVGHARQFRAVATTTGHDAPSLQATSCTPIHPVSQLRARANSVLPDASAVPAATSTSDVALATTKPSRRGASPDAMPTMRCVARASPLGAAPSTNSRPAE